MPPRNLQKPARWTPPPLACQLKPGRTMGEFDKDWLSLREPADHLARDTDLLQSLLEHLRAASDATTSTGSDMDHARSLSVVDLGTGTGSNLRYLQPRLGAHQRWQLVDNDPALLQVLPERLNAWAADQQLALFDNHSRIDGTAAQGHANSFLIDVISLERAAPTWPQRLRKQALR